MLDICVQTPDVNVGRDSYCASKYALQRKTSWYYSSICLYYTIYCIDDCTKSPTMCV